MATPASGVAVLVGRAGDGTLVSRALTGAAGTWPPAVSTDSLRVRALCIGQEPVELATLRLGVGEARGLSAELPARGDGHRDLPIDRERALRAHPRYGAGVVWHRGLLDGAAALDVAAHLLASPAHLP